MVGERILKAPKRVTLLLRAVSREILISDQNTPDFIKQMLKRDLCDNHFKYAHLESENTPHSSLQVNLSDVATSRIIDSTTENPDFPYHPKTACEFSLGSTRFEQADGNTLKL